MEQVFNIVIINIRCGEEIKSFEFPVPVEKDPLEIIKELMREFQDTGLKLESIDHSRLRN